MAYVAQFGYPAPRVEEISADGSELVMERVDGSTMLEVLSRRPWLVRRNAFVLAALHERLHAIPGPEWLDPFVDGGGRVIHLDLHPLNTSISRSCGLPSPPSGHGNARIATCALRRWLPSSGSSRGNPADVNGLRGQEPTQSRK